MEVIKSQKGGLKIMQDMIYMYAKKSASRWECSYCIAFLCKADILEMKNVISSTPHIHDPHDTAFSVTKLCTTMLVPPCWKYL